MSVDRVASFASTNSLISQALRIQSDYNAADLQTSSGLKSEYYSGISSDAQQVVDLTSQYDKTNAYISTVQSATNKLNAQTDALSNISDLITQIKSQLTSAASGTNTSSTSTVTADQANSWETELASLLNTQYAGSYIFGGSVTDTAPVNLNATGYNPTSVTTADTTYYQGNDTATNIRASNTLTVSYAVSADNTAFEKVFRALSLVAANPSSQSTISSALNLIDTSSNEVADLSGQLSTKSSELSTESDLLTATQSHLSSSITDLRNVDTAAASANLTQIQTQLEAAYDALSKILQLRLSDYLK